MAAAEDAAGMLTHAEAVFDLLADRERRGRARDHNGVESVLALSRRRAFHAAMLAEGVALSGLGRKIHEGLKPADEGRAA